MAKASDMYAKKNRTKYGVEGNVLKTPTVVKEQKDNSNVHAGHRERLRERFLREGLENFEEHNVLELLLFYTIPIKDTNEEAHNLINTFGSLSEVFDAKYEDLCKVKGIGERTATLIKLVPELFRKYEINKLNKGEMILNSPDLVAKYVSRYFKGLTEEKLYVLCLDSNCKKLGFELISTGIANTTVLDNRLIAKYAYMYDAASILLVHNHPSGIMAPSKGDVNATIKIADAMKAIGIKLNDHIIIGNGDDYFSFRNSDKWKGIF